MVFMSFSLPFQSDVYKVIEILLKIHREASPKSLIKEFMGNKFLEKMYLNLVWVTREYFYVKMGGF